jgi:hypothetical protein
MMNMVDGHDNRVVDLGVVAIANDPDVRQGAADQKTAWQNVIANAVAGHVYLEQVRDQVGNDFFVLFQVVAVDRDSRYMAFVWRRLPA